MEHWLSGVSRVSWGELKHAYGSAGDIPRLLWRLTSPYLDERDQAGRDLFSAICHQGDHDTATLAAIPFLARLAQSEGTGAYEAANLLAGFYLEASYRKRPDIDDQIVFAIRSLGTLQGAPQEVESGMWSCGFGGQRPRAALTDAEVCELVAALDSTQGFKAQVDALQLAWELGGESHHDAALDVLGRVTDPTLFAKAEFARLFTLHVLRRVDFEWRIDARDLIDRWMRESRAIAGDDRSSIYRQLNAGGMTWLAERLPDAALVQAIAACPEPDVYELSPWGHWQTAVAPEARVD